MAATNQTKTAWRRTDAAPMSPTCFFFFLYSTEASPPSTPRQPTNLISPWNHPRAESSFCVGTSFLNELFLLRLHSPVHRLMNYYYLFLLVPNLSLFSDCWLYFIFFIFSYLPFGVTHFNLICRAIRYNIKHKFCHLMHCSRVSLELIFPQEVRLLQFFGKDAI